MASLVELDEHLLQRVIARDGVCRVLKLIEWSKALYGHLCASCSNDGTG
jgi:hypothetical protein